MPRKARSSKIISLDLDDTLLTSDKRVTPASQQFLLKLRQAGHYVVINSGRIRSAILHATDGAKFATHLISDGGARLYDLANHRQPINNFISRAELAKIATCPDQWLAHMDFCDEEWYWKFYADPHYHRTEGSCGRIVATKQDLLRQAHEVGHIALVPRTGNDLAALAAWFEELALPDAELMLMQDSGGTKQWYNIIPRGTRKYRALIYLAEQLGLSNDDIIAFGDGLNDLEILAQCGCGVAMANALPEVKAVADTVTGLDNDHDGVIDYLAKYL